MTHLYSLDSLPLNSSLTLPFSIIREYVDVEDWVNADKSSLKRLCWVCFCFATAFFGYVCIVGDFDSAISFSKFILVIVLILLIAGYIDHHNYLSAIKRVENINQISTLFSVDNKNLVIVDEFSKKKKVIPIQNVLKITHNVSSYKGNVAENWLDISYKSENKIRVLRNLVMWRPDYLFVCYININGEYYVLSNADIKNILENAIEFLKKNPNATEIPLNRRLFCN